MVCSFASMALSNAVQTASRKFHNSVFITKKHVIFLYQITRVVVTTLQAMPSVQRINYAPFPGENFNLNYTHENCDFWICNWDYCVGTLHHSCQLKINPQHFQNIQLEESRQGHLLVRISSTRTQT